MEHLLPFISLASDIIAMATAIITLVDTALRHRANPTVTAITKPSLAQNRDQSQASSDGHNTQNIGSARLHP